MATLSKAFNRNKIALTKAVSQTKAQLKGVAKEIKVVTYPKGVWKKTLAKNFEKNVALLGGKSEKKSTAKKATPKKSVSKAAPAKKATPKKAKAKKATPKKATVKRTVTKRTKAKK